MFYRVFNIIIIVWLLFLSSHTIILTKEAMTVQLKSNNLVDVCGNKKNSVIVYIDIGNILKSDSLAGYNFELLYNDEKLKFNTALATGSLTEGISAKDFNFADPGKIFGYALKTNGLIEGNKPLIAFLGDYKGDCPDSAFVNISFIEFTEYFKKKADTLKNCFVEALVFEKDERFLSSQFELDSIIIPFEENTVSSKVMIYSYDDARLDTVDFQINISDIERFEVQSISSNTDNIEILDFNSETGILRTVVDASIKEDDWFIIELNEKLKDENSVQLNIAPIKINDCSCISFLRGSKQILKSEIKDTTSTEDTTANSVYIKHFKEIESFYNKALEEFVILDKNMELESVSLMTLEGKILQKKDLLNRQNRYSIDVSNYANGLFLVQLKNRNVIKNILLIKY
ncbi:MAG: hypothetical protein GX121_07900 [Ignavibacteria bacterium]|jgi:hypothetical protein|nr:hypothetical protein [Ignavibacteria bacterium]